MIRLFTAVGIVAMCWLTTEIGAATPPNRVMSFYAQYPVTLSCEPLKAADGPEAWSEQATHTVHMDVSHCRELNRPRAVEFPFAVTILIHEAAHQRFGDITNNWQGERRAQCFAEHNLRHALQRFYGWTRQAAIQALRQVQRNAECASWRVP